MTEQQTAILAFEHRWWRYQGSKEQTIHDELGLSPIRYYQLLARLLDDPEALQADPAVVNRLRRLRTARQRGREHLGQGLGESA